jgi:hypothetical protein
MSIDKVNGVLWSSIVKITSVVKANIAKVSGVSSPVDLYSSLLYSWENQTPQENAASDWVVSTPMSDAPAWVNGTSAVDGTFWGLTSNKTVKGWNCGQNNPPSSNTGPAGGATTPDGTPTTSIDSNQYMYTETSSSRNLYCFVARTGGYNFSTLMSDTSNNIDLTFWVHGYGAAMGDLFTYIDTSTTSNDTNATLLNSQTTFTQTSRTSNYTEITVSLNSYRTVNSDHYIYFISQNGTSFTSDLAVDLVQITESVP